MRGLVIGMAAAFVVGVSSGLIGGILLMRFGPPGGQPFGMMPPWAHVPPRVPPGPGAEHTMLLHRLGRELGLTAEQRGRVMEILERVHEQREAERESVRVRIERELTPEQRERWQALLQRYDSMWRRRAGRPGPGEDRP